MQTRYIKQLKYTSIQQNINQLKTKTLFGVYPIFKMVNKLSCLFLSDNSKLNQSHMLRCKNLTQTTVFDTESKKMNTKEN